jgi:two-component sensor histidine kinase
VGTIARAHERLYQTSDIGEIDIGALIKDVCGDLPVSDGTTVTVEAPGGIRLSADQAISLALIVVELATNAIKYAYGGDKGVIRVALAREGDALALSVRDDGCGVPAGFVPEKSKGLGMRVVVALAKQLDAELRVRRLDKGTSIELHVPLRQPA